MSKKRHKKKKKHKTPVFPGGQGNSYEIGLKHFQNGNYRDAIKAWRTMPPDVEITAKLAEAYFRYGLSFYTSGQVVQVLSELHQAVKFNPEKAIYCFHLGLAYHRKGNLEKAITWYEKALEADPQNSRFRYHLGLAWIEAGAIGKAKEHFHSIHRESEEDKTLWKLGLTSALLKEQRWDKALDLLRDVDDGIPYFQSLKGLTLLMMGKEKQAKVALDKSIKAGATDPLVRYYLGLAYAADGDLPAVVKAWEEALKKGLSPHLIEADLAAIYHRFAIQEVKKGALAKAAGFWEKVLELRPRDEVARDNLVHACFLMGNRYSKENRLRKAIGWWEKVVALDPKNLEVLHNLALAYDQLGETLMANRYWTKVVNSWGKLQRSDEELRGSLYLAHRHLANNYLKMDKPDKAASEYRKAMRYKPNDVETSIRLAELWLGQNNPVAAMRELNRVQRIDPENTDLLGTLAMAYCKHGDCQKALACWKKIILIDPTNKAAAEQFTDCLLHQAYKQWQRGETDQALSQLNEAMGFCPDCIPLYLLMGEIHLDVGEPARAREIFNQAITIQPERPDLHFGVGNAYLKHQMAKEAERHFERAIACAPGDYNLLIAIGESYFHANRFKTSRRYLRKALDANPRNPFIPLEIGAMLLNDGFADRSIPYFKKALRLSPDIANAHFFLGFAHFQEKNYLKAGKALDQARKLAKRENDEELLEAIKDLQDIIELVCLPLEKRGYHERRSL